MVASEDGLYGITLCGTPSPLQTLTTPGTALKPPGVSQARTLFVTGMHDVLVVRPGFWRTNFESPPLLWKYWVTLGLSQTLCLAYLTRVGFVTEWRGE